MTTKDLQQIDELVQVADIAVRVASQLRLWLKRHELRDQESVDEGIRFLEEAARGGQFVDTGTMTAGLSSLSPLTWSADVRFGLAGPFAAASSPVNYDELVSYLKSLQKTLNAVVAGDQIDEGAIQSAATFFDQLGRFLGGKADSALRSSSGGIQVQNWSS